MRETQLVLIRLNENSSVSEMHSGSANLEEAAKEIVTPDLWQSVFFPIFTFYCVITRHGAGWMAWAGCDDIEYL